MKSKVCNFSAKSAKISRNAIKFDVETLQRETAKNRRDCGAISQSRKPKNVKFTIKNPKQRRRYAVT